MRYLQNHPTKRTPWQMHQMMMATIKKKMTMTMTTKIQKGITLYLLEFCAICQKGNFTNDNQIVFCEGKCGLGFHQQCYGIKVIPPGDEPWYCDWCSTGNISTYGKHLYCCHYKSEKTARTLVVNDGASEPTSMHVHVQCAAWIPTVDTSHIPFTTTVPKLISLKGKRCYFCRSPYGYQVLCTHGKGDKACVNTYHPMCGMRYEFLKVPTVYNIKYTDFLCPRHASSSASAVKRKRDSEGEDEPAAKIATRRQSALSFIASPNDKNEVAEMEKSASLRPTREATASVSEAPLQTPAEKVGSSSAKGGTASSERHLPLRRSSRLSADQSEVTMPLRGHGREMARLAYHRRSLDRVKSELGPEWSNGSSEDGINSGDDDNSGDGGNDDYSSDDSNDKLRFDSVSRSNSPEQLGNMDAGKMVIDNQEDTFLESGRIGGVQAAGTSSAPISASNSAPAPTPASTVITANGSADNFAGEHRWAVGSCISNSTPADDSTASEDGSLPSVNFAPQANLGASSVPTTLPVPTLSQSASPNQTDRNADPKKSATQGKRAIIRVRPFVYSANSLRVGPSPSDLPLSAGCRPFPPTSSAVEMLQKVIDGPIRLPEEQAVMIKETHEMLRNQNELLNTVHNMLKNMSTNPPQQAQQIRQMQLAQQTQQALSAISSLSALVSNNLNTTGDDSVPPSPIVNSVAIMRGSVNGPAGSGMPPRPPPQTINGAAGAMSDQVHPSPTHTPPEPNQAHTGNVLDRGAAPDSNAPMPPANRARLVLPKSVAGMPTANSFLTNPTSPNGLAAQPVTRSRVVNSPTPNASAINGPMTRRSGSNGPATSSSAAKSPATPAATISSVPLATSAKKNPTRETDELDEMKDNVIYLIRSVNVPQLLSDILSRADTPATAASAGSAGGRMLSPQLRVMLAELRRIGVISKDNVDEHLKVIVNSLRAARSNK
ncbi:hypothetical protein LPJ66_003831 [Kickxella alabastrina]|uniref:Uncharacterized protein n=1 Tax=Kickxella alabastrina TaxID=61397 RepID=A0ACC1IMG3_9FUNG|nr:hypothetical protein LPJ66_003831 [Kickxella alabastrina]